MVDKIELFVHDNRPLCKIFKKYLEEKNIKFDYINIFEDQTYAVDCGVRGVPHLIIDKVNCTNLSFTQFKEMVAGF